MKYIRGHNGVTRGCAAMWQTLQPRLQQYAKTGKGSFAEAIVYNYYYWKGQVAHEIL